MATPGQMLVESKFQELVGQGDTDRFWVWFERTYATHYMYQTVQLTVNDECEFIESMELLGIEAIWIDGGTTWTLMRKRDD
jgi:hypothetical protein